MKSALLCPSRYITYRRQADVPYPNAHRRRLLHRLVDGLLAAACTLAVVVILMFLAAIT